MEVIKSYWAMVKKTNGDKLFYSFLTFYFIDCFIILLLDPRPFNGQYGNALWFGFSIATSIGFGDYTVTSNLARIFTAILGIYGAIMVAYIPGLVASYYLQNMAQRRDDILKQHAKDLGNLDHLSHEEKQNLTKAIREGRNKS